MAWRWHPIAYVDALNIDICLANVTTAHVIRRLNSAVERNQQILATARHMQTQRCEFFAAVVVSLWNADANVSNLLV